MSISPSPPQRKEWSEVLEGHAIGLSINSPLKSTLMGRFAWGRAVIRYDKQKYVVDQKCIDYSSSCEHIWDIVSYNETMSILYITTGCSRSIWCHLYMHWHKKTHALSVSVKCFCVFVHILVLFYYYNVMHSIIVYFVFGIANKRGMVDIVDKNVVWWNVFDKHISKCSLFTSKLKFGICYKYEYVINI